MRYALLTLAATVGYSLLDKSAMAAFSQTGWSSVLPRTIVYLLLLEVLGVALFLPLALREVGHERLKTLARLEVRPALGAALIAFASYTLILEAFQTAPVSYVVAVRQSSVLFALTLGALFLRERPSGVRLLGGVATVLGVALVSLA
jgi:drug/metabolite transporter (DMT)-like permease